MEIPSKKSSVSIIDSDIRQEIICVHDSALRKLSLFIDNMNYNYKFWAFLSTTWTTIMLDLEDTVTNGDI